MKITFFGAVEEVTGSRYLVEDTDTKILVDCGMFQGLLSKHNWDPFPLDPQSVDALVLTHAHIDHTGYIPLFVKNGFAGRIYCSKATYELCVIMLMDSAGLQEEEVKHINKRRDPELAPVEPLYTKLDVEHALKFFEPSPYDTILSIKSLQLTLISSHHIIGSSFVVISDGKEKLTFSGDLGRPDQLIIKSPPLIKETDFLVLESTYGDRLHGEADPIKALGDIVNETVKKGGILIIPSFAVARAQTILYCLYQLKQKKAIPDIPVFLDSPMGISVTDLFCKFKDEHTPQADAFCKDIKQVAQYTNTPDESKLLDHLTKPAIIIAGSGMADGGRVMYHLQNYISDAKNTVAFVGFQAMGTKGRRLVDGEKEIKFYGKWYTVNAAIKTIHSLSAHADYNEILQWLSGFEKPPKKVFLTHGEVDSAAALKHKIEEKFGWPVVIPKLSESFDLD